MKNRILLMLMLLICSFSVHGGNKGGNSPKREFRGVWMPTVTGQYKGMSEKEMKARLIKELDMMQEIGINAVIFQIRPEADAWYKSTFEPWSRFITGTQGKDPGWDPTKFMIDECHKRGMEFHAWINPYRVKTSQMTVLDPRHLYFRHPEYFFEYGGQTFFDPSLQASQDFICNVIKDIVLRYDVDAIHMDDYFYPYPKPTESLPDFYSFKGHSRGFENIGDWRRDNVNKLINKIHETLMETAPWVQFGISPFGIYRNVSSDPNGSKTKGLQNYDDLYADILLWDQKGWLDYVIPQIYWEIGHPAADYEELLDWWSKNIHHSKLYIGQDVARSVKNANQQRQKLNMERANGNVDGYCMWPIKELVNNTGNYASVLKKEYNCKPAIPVVIDRFKEFKSEPVSKLKVVNTSYGKYLFWTAPKVKDCFNKTTKYCVYRFDKKKDISIDKADNILCITTDNHVKLPEVKGKKKYYYVITAFDRFNNESKKKIKKVKL